MSNIIWFPSETLYRPIDCLCNTLISQSFIYFLHISQMKCLSKVSAMISVFSVGYFPTNKLLCDFMNYSTY